MKHLTEWQVNYVKQDISNSGVYSTGLLNELTDHICSMIEESGFDDGTFFEVHQRVVKEFDPSGFSLIQELTNKITNNKKLNEMKTVKLLIVILTAYATFVMLLSSVPGFMNNPSANALRMTGFIVYATVLLLLSFFIIRFRMRNNSIKIITVCVGYLFAFLLITLAVGEINSGAGNSLFQIAPYLSAAIMICCAISLYRFRRSLSRNDIIN